MANIIANGFILLDILLILKFALFFLNKFCSNRLQSY